MKLNWEEQSENAQMKEIRKESVRLYTGTGAQTSKDGIFRREQKWAANRASGLNQDALDLQMKEQWADSDASMQVDNEADNGQQDQFRFDV